MRPQFAVVLVVFGLGCAHADDQYPDKRLARSMELYRIETGLDSPEVKAMLHQKDTQLKSAQDAIVAAESAISAAQGALAKASPGGKKAASDSTPAQPTGLAEAQVQATASVSTVRPRLTPLQQAAMTSVAKAPATSEQLGSLVADQEKTEANIARLYTLKAGSLENALAAILKKPDSPDAPSYQLVWRAPTYEVQHSFEVEATDSLDLLQKVLAAYKREGVPLEAVLFTGNNVIQVGLGGWRSRTNLPVDRYRTLGATPSGKE